jgi:hypothetical protein
MEICRDNYEAFLLDLMEGRLTESRKEDLLRFLGENPDLAVDFDFDIITIPDDAVYFPQKGDLKKGDCGQEVTRANFGQFCIARMEGDLSEARVRELEVFLENNPDCAGEASIYSRLHLVPDESVVFPMKNTIRKKRLKGFFPGMQPVNRLILTWGSVAASIAILIAVWLSDPGSVITSVSPGTSVSQHDESAVQGSPGILPVSPVPAENISNISTDIYVPLPEPLVEINNAASPAGNHAVIREQPLPGLERPGLRNIRVNTDEGSDRNMSFLAGSLPVAPNLYSIPYVDEYPPENHSPVAGLIASLSNIPERSEEGERFTLRQLAQAGINGLNSLGGSRFLYERETDPSGERVRVAFTAGPIEFRRSVSRTGE